MTEGKMIQEMVGAISWAKNGAFSEKKCQKIAVDAAKAYAAAQVAAKDADLKRITHERDVLCEIRDMSYREIAALKADKERMREGISDIDIIMDDSNLSISEARHAVFSKVQSLLSPADDTYDSGKFGAPNNLDRPSTECLCSHTIDGRLVKQCEACRNKPFVPADGVLVSTKPDIETQQEDVMVVGNCANCGVEFHIHRQESPADGDGVEEAKSRIKELEMVIEYAAECLDLTHPKDGNLEERLNAIYRNLENKTRFEI